MELETFRKLGWVAFGICFVDIFYLLFKSDDFYLVLILLLALCFTMQSILLISIVEVLIDKNIITNDKEDNKC